MMEIKTFGEALDYHADCLRAKGWLSKSWAEKFARVRAELGRLALDEVPDRLEKWRDDFVSTPCRGKTRLPASMNNPIRPIRATFNQIIKAGIIKVNPITWSRFPIHKENIRNRYLNRTEREKIFGAIREKRPCIETIIKYMIAVPCRVNELVAAKREAYDDETKTIYIPTSKSRIPIYKPVPENMIDYFRSIPPACPWLFYWVDKRGKYRPLTSVQRWWSECRGASGVSDIRIHDLRHVAATDLLLAGNPTWLIMDIAGWKTDMFRVYWHKSSFMSAQRVKFAAV